MIEFLSVTYVCNKFNVTVVALSYGASVTSPSKRYTIDHLQGTGHEVKNQFGFKDIMILYRITYTKSDYRYAAVRCSRNSLFIIRPV